MKYKFGLFLFVIFLLGFVSAGVGISWDKESALVPEKTETCLTYKVYNPLSKDSYAKILVSSEFDEIILKSESEIKFIPANTSSNNAIPINFCFKTPVVYNKDCLVGNYLLCKQECNEEMKVYEGEVQIIEVSESELSQGQGSKTEMSVSAPLRIRVQCISHSRDYSIIYITIGIIAGILLIFNLIGRKKVNKKKH